MLGRLTTLPFVLFVLVGLVLLPGCGEKDTFVVLENPFEGSLAGSESTLEIVTWNVEHFPKEDQTTVDYLIQAIEALDVDIIALQEIENNLKFRELYNGLEGWNGVNAGSASYNMNLAYLYKTGGPIDNITFREILTNEDALPRAPYVMECTFDGVPLVIINNHYKCCGDNVIEDNNDWDEETRRRDGNLILQEYIEAHFAAEKVIVLGDMNDELTDAPEANVFANFLNDPDNWRFVDLAIAEDSNAQWSYPSWPSHIDHILITDELFAEHDGREAEVSVLPLHSYFSSFSEYDRDISDHLPVMFKFKPLPVDTDEREEDPNPFEGATVGTASALEIVTWNLEHFAKDGQATIDYLIQAIETLDVDILALQEIEDSLEFYQLHNGLEGWSGEKAGSASYDMDLAYLYKTDGALDDISFREILTDEDALPRAPYVMECTFNGVPLVIINNHFKCCGDGEIDEGREWDEEYRRLQSSILLDEYIEANLADQRVILLGDLNDELTDNPDDNVFANFLNNPARWRFVDLSIAEDKTVLWSYPSWPSHIDHILITDELFTAHEAPGSEVMVLPMHSYFNSFPEYVSHLSDHLPVMFKFIP